MHLSATLQIHSCTSFAMYSKYLKASLLCLHKWKAHFKKNPVFINCNFVTICRQDKFKYHKLTGDVNGFTPRQTVPSHSRWVPPIDFPQVDHNVSFGTLCDKEKILYFTNNWWNDQESWKMNEIPLLFERMKYKWIALREVIRGEIFQQCPRASHHQKLKHLQIVYNCTFLHSLINRLWNEKWFSYQSFWSFYNTLFLYWSA